MVPFETIKHFPIFQNFTSEEAHNLLSNAIEKKLSPGEILFKTGQHRDTFFVVIKGSIAILKELSKQTEIVTVVTPGEYITEHALFDPKSKHSHGARAHSPNVHVLALSGASFRQLGFPVKFKLVENLLPLISENFAHATNTIVTLAQVGNVIARTRNNIRRLGEAILEILLEPIRAERALLIVFNEKAHLAHIRATYGFEDNQLLNQTIPLNNDPFLQKLTHHKKVINIREEEYHSSAERVPYARRSILGVPLIAGGTLIGALVLIDKKIDGGFTSNNEVLVTLVAHTASLGLYQALRSEIHEAEKELKREYVGL